ncbi:MAG: methyl-accepting chemotaxis protein [Pseudomonadota bacterium]
MLNAQKKEYENAVPASDQEANTSAVETLSKARLETAINHLGSRIGELSVNIAGISGTVGDVSVDLSKQVDDFGTITTSVHQISSTNTEITNVLGNAKEIASNVHSGLSESTGLVERVFANSASDMHKIAESSEAVVSELDGVNANISQVYSFSESIQKIATQTQTLAINAGIMAARAGEEGKGFAIVAEAIRELAQQTTSVSNEINAQLNTLKDTVGELLKYGETNNKVALEAKERTEKMDDELRNFRSFGEQVETLTASISELSGPVEQNVAICSQVVSKMHDLDGEAKSNSSALSRTSESFDSLVSFTEEMIRLIEESGIETEDTPLIRSCMDTAGRIAALFEDAIARNMISIDALFDETYRPIPGTDPQQVMTAFTEFTDRVMPEIQEPFLDTDPRIAFCAAVDRNGYLPTHNKTYSKPQSSDPVWNAANCRNRRIFDDRTGLAAGRNTKPFLLQTYRRDMGGGTFTLMKDLSAPILVKDRHWGGFRVGFKVG